MVNKQKIIRETQLHMGAFKLLSRRSCAARVGTGLGLSSGEIRRQAATRPPTICDSINITIMSLKHQKRMDLPVFFIVFLSPEDEALVKG
jgi:hypothetical protein